MLNNSYACKKPRSGVLPQPTTTTVAPGGHCKPGFAEYMGYCYKIYTDYKKVWDQSVEACKELGQEYDLASFHSLREQSFAITLMQLNNVKDDVWIGATDQFSESHWMWTDYSPFDFSNWDVGEPNNRDEYYSVIFRIKSGKSKNCQIIFEIFHWPMQSSAHIIQQNELFILG